MKAIFEFNLPKEQKEYDIYRNAINMYKVLCYFEQRVLRPALKYGLTEKFDTPEKVIEEINREFYRLMEEYGVEL